MCTGSCLVCFFVFSAPRGGCFQLIVCCVCSIWNQNISAVCFIDVILHYQTKKTQQCQLWTVVKRN